jgi:hypothetical protein
MQHHNTRLPPQSLFGQFKFPVTYHLCNKKTRKIRGNVVTMICHIFEPISFFYCVVIAIVIFNYNRGPCLFCVMDGCLSSMFFQNTIKFVVKVRKMYVAFYSCENSLCRVVTKVFLAQRYVGCLPNHVFLLESIIGFYNLQFCYVRYYIPKCMAITVVHWWYMFMSSVNIGSVEYELDCMDKKRW